MKVAIEKTFPMPGSIDAVWVLLQNIEGVARCMPGAKITERLDDTHFKGTVAIKVGPASMAFKGDIEVKELDVTQHVLHLLGKGSDSSGTSGASMDLIARIEAGATPESSNLIGKSEVTMSGKAAAFGGRMMGSVADQILKQFAANFAKQVGAVSGGAPSPVAAPVSAPVVGSPTMSALAAPGLAPAVASAPAATSTPMSATAASSAATAPTAIRYAPIAVEEPVDAPANEINALALFWAIIRDWFRGLFRRKPA
jgi:carbon monoxide dehydrogenase subunit G